MNILPRISYWPDTGERIVGANTPPSVQEWRHSNPDSAWLYNPWSGTKRLSKDVAADLFGRELVPPESTPAPKPYTFIIAPLGVTELDITTLNEYLHSAPPGAGLSLTIAGNIQGLMVVRTEDHMRAAAQVFGLMGENSTLRQCIERAQVTLDDLNDTLQAAVAAPEGAG